MQKALQDELDRVKTEGVTADELNRAKRQFARDYILGRETVQQKALHLAHAVVIHNDIKTADGEFDLFQNVTVADVQRVARTYFTPESRMFLTILPGTPAGAGGAGRSGRASAARAIVRALLASASLFARGSAVAEVRFRRRYRRDAVSFPPDEIKTLPTACRSWSCSTTSSRR